MRRLILGLVIGALIFGVAFAGAKVATVTNPMSADLDAAGHAISNVGDLTATGNINFQAGVLTRGVAFDMLDGTALSVVYGTDDPRGAFQASGGSLYLRRIGTPSPFGGGTTGELWVKTGPSPADWTKVTP